MKKTVAAILFLLFLHTSHALANEPPAALVQAIARQESGLNPLAINVAGKSYAPSSKEEATRIIQAAMQAGLSFDVGKMQINRWWIERFSLDPVSLLDPATNEAWGKRILAAEIARHGLNWQAVGKYHSPDPERGRQYAWLVYKHYAGQGASKQPLETLHAQQETRSQNLPGSRGIQSSQGVSQQGRPTSFYLQQKSVPWVFRPKSGTSGRTN